MINAEIEQDRAKMYRTLFFYAGTGFDPAICDSEDGQNEVQNFFDNATEAQNDELLIYYNALSQMNGFEWANEMCRSLSVLKKYPIICKHLTLSIYS